MRDGDGMKVWRKEEFTVHDAIGGGGIVTGWKNMGDKKLASDRYKDPSRHSEE